MKVLVTTPDTSFLGGVANHYEGLRAYWSEEVKYHFVGSRKIVPGIYMLPFDLFLFAFKLVFGSYDAVLINPSLGKKSLNRDAVFLRLASFFKIKKVVFFHGWNEDVASQISKNPKIFVSKYDCADAFLVLSNTFKEALESWGVNKPVLVVTTKFDDALIKDFDVNEKKFDKTVLFLARVEKNKGIFIALDAFSKLVVSNPKARLLVAGSGGALGDAKAMVKERSIPNVKFLGAVYGDALVQAFVDSNIYIFPTSHGEGMPTSVLEAMAFGLPVITRPVGGLKDFFCNGKMGFISESLDPEWYADAMSKLFSEPQLMRDISLYNHAYAKKHFSASKVARQLEAILEAV